jgi:hypothetical protein
MKRRALPPISSVVGCVRPWREEEHESTVDADRPVVIAQAHKHNAFDLQLQKFTHQQDAAKSPCFFSFFLNNSLVRLT